MLPILSAFGRDFSTYGLCALVGIFAAGLFACGSIRRFAPNDHEDMLQMLLWSSVGVMIGGHLLYALTNFHLLVALIQNIYKASSFGDLIGAASMVFGGSVFYGGFLGGAAAALIYIRCKKLDFKVYSDVAAPAIPLFHAFGRIGCFLGGCCYGVESPVGFVFEHSLLEAANGVRRFPIQLVESAYNFLLFAVLAFLLYRRLQKGHLLQIYILAYGVGRFAFEFFRGDEIRGFWFGLSTSQWIALLLVVATVIWLAAERLQKKSRRIQQE
ncbi:MAG: prolipoprotein diacylglyceryl transferase [Acutalibacteraceae bacterium]